MQSQPDQRSALLRNLRNNSKAARTRLALSGSAVELLTGLPTGTVDAVENGGETPLDAVELRRLAEAIGLTPDGQPRVRW